MYFDCVQFVFLLVVLLVFVLLIGLYLRVGKLEREVKRGFQDLARRGESRRGGELRPTAPRGEDASAEDIPEWEESPVAEEEAPPASWPTEEEEPVAPAPTPEEPARPAPRGVGASWTDRHRRSDEPSFESVVGRVWLVRVGALLLVCGMGFLYRLMVERGLLSEPLRLTLGLAASLLLTVAARAAEKRDWTALAQGLAGAGMALAGLTLYAGYGLWDLYGAEVALAGMSAVIVLTVFLALRMRALALAILATLGGLVTPWLASFGPGLGDVGRLYLLALGAGVFWLATHTGWASPRWVVAGGLLLSLWSDWRDRLTYVEGPAPQVWICLFHGLLLAGFLLRARGGRQPRVLGATEAVLANAALWTWMVQLDGRSHGRVPFLTDLDRLREAGLVAILIGALHVGLGALLARRPQATSLPEGRIPGVFVLAGTLAMVPGLALAIELPRATPVIAAWALAALWMARGPSRRYAECGAALAWGTSLVIFLGVHVPIPTGSTHELFFASETFLSSLGLVAVSIACAVVRPAERAAFGFGATMIAAVTLVREFEYQARVGGEVLERSWETWAVLAQAATWLLGAHACARLSRLPRGWAVRYPAAVLGALAAGYMAATFGELQEPRAWLVLNSHFLVGLVLVGGLCVLGARLLRNEGAPTFTSLEGYLWRGMVALGILLGWGLFSFEAWNHFRDAEGFTTFAAHGALSISWAIYAGALLVTGIAVRAAAPRIAALMLFLMTAVKVVLVDLSRLDQLWRVLSWIALGLLLMACAWLYHRFARRLFGRN